MGGGWMEGGITKEDKETRNKYKLLQREQPETYKASVFSKNLCD